MGSCVDVGGIEDAGAEDAAASDTGTFDAADADAAAPDAAAPDAAAPDTGPDAGMDPGPPCTPPCLVVDTDTAYSTVQGAEGVWYGYYDASIDVNGSYDHAADFLLMEPWGAADWKPPGSPATQDQPGWVWTGINRNFAHPDADPEQWAIKRWVSSWAGDARLEAGGDYLGGGDGVRVSVYVDGVLSWTGLTTTTGSVSCSFPLKMQVGTNVDLTMSANVTDFGDSTYYVLRVFAE